MKLSKAVRPISYFKAHAAQVIRDVAESDESVVITQGGEAKAVVMSMHGYEELQDTLTVLKLVAFGRDEVRHGRTKPMRDAFRQVRARTKPPR
jgi:prevent-host-death family protein